jgi:hypothetical protein
MKKLLLALITSTLLSGSIAMAADQMADKCCCGKDKASCAACSDKDHPCEKCAKMEKDAKDKGAKMEKK